MAECDDLEVLRQELQEELAYANDLVFERHGVPFGADSTCVIEELVEMMLAIRR